MKIRDITLTINYIDNDVQTDVLGIAYLKCKGREHYKAVIKNNRKINACNFFSSVRLYPYNMEQLIETKRRLYDQTSSNAKIKIVVYDADLYTNIIGGKICPILNVNKYDFEKHKLFNKRTLLKGE